METLSAKNMKWVPRGEIDRHPDANPKELGVKAKSEAIAANFDPGAFGVVTVSKQKDGRYVCLDGQTRLLAVGLLKWTKAQKVPCVVHEGLTRPEEAGLFQRLNNHVVVPFTARFMSRVVSGDPIAVAISAIVKKQGFRIGHKAKDDVISAANALESVYMGRKMRFNTPSPEALEMTLHSISAAYGRTRDSVDRHLIEGIGLFWLKHPKADVKRFVKKLIAHRGGVGTVVNRGKGKQDIHGVTLPMGIARHLTDEYNKGTRGKSRLNGWD